MEIKIDGVNYRVISITNLTTSFHVVFMTDIGERAVNLGQAQLKNQVSILEPKVKF